MRVKVGIKVGIRVDARHSLRLNDQSQTPSNHAIAVATALRVKKGVVRVALHLLLRFCRLDGILTKLVCIRLTPSENAQSKSQQVECACGRGVGGKGRVWLSLTVRHALHQPHVEPDPVHHKRLGASVSG